MKSRLQRVFLTGLVVILPLVVTVLVFKFIFELLDNSLGPIVSRLLIEAGFPIPVDYVIPGIGFVATFAIVISVGLFTTNYLGRKLIGLGEMILTRIPVFRSVYIGAKQIIDTFSTSNSRAFSKVVMFEYPRRGLWCLAFITGDTTGETQMRTNKKLVNIFLPTTPNPTSGFLLLAPEEDLIELDMSVEEGIKMIISGGVVTPPWEGKVIDAGVANEPGSAHE